MRTRDSVREVGNPSAAWLCLGSPVKEWSGMMQSEHLFSDCSIHVQKTYSEDKPIEQHNHFVTGTSISLSKHTCCAAASGAPNTASSRASVSASAGTSGRLSLEPASAGLPAPVVQTGQPASSAPVQPDALAARQQLQPTPKAEELLDHLSQYAKVCCRVKMQVMSKEPALMGQRSLFWCVCVCMPELTRSRTGRLCGSAVAYVVLRPSCLCCYRGARPGLRTGMMRTRSLMPSRSCACQPTQF
jgi:hypothetical protein